MPLPEARRGWGWGEKVPAAWVANPPAPPLPPWVRGRCSPRSHCGASSGCSLPTNARAPRAAPWFIGKRTKDDCDNIVTAEKVRGRAPLPVRQATARCVGTLTQTWHGGAGLQTALQARRGAQWPRPLLLRAEPAPRICRTRVAALVWWLPCRFADASHSCGPPPPPPPTPLSSSSHTFPFLARSRAAFLSAKASAPPTSTSCVSTTAAKPSAFASNQRMAVSCSPTSSSRTSMR